MGTDVGDAHRPEDKAFLLAAGPLLDELAELGYPSDALELFISGQIQDYRDAVPVLIKWLPRIEDEHVKEMVARALTVKWANDAAPVLVSEFRKTSHQPLKWAIGNALEQTADDRVFEEIADLATDSRHGRGRQMLALALGRMKDPRAVDVLVQLLDDPEIAGHALRGLRRTRAKKGRRKIENLLNHEHAWIRREAKKALDGIDAQQNQ